MTVGLFVGLVTLDLIYLTDVLPQPNQKQVALDYSMTAGGPATNAAIAFRFLSGHSTPSPTLPNAARLLGVIGNHPVSRFVSADLQVQQIETIDLQPDASTPVPTSSILVTQATGERAVISINALRRQASPDQIPAEILSGVAVVLIDGHQMAVGEEIARRAKAAQIPVVVDGGSWKPGFEAVLRYADYAICSANFLPPHCQTQSELLSYLQSLGISHAAITRGAEPILYYYLTAAGIDQGELAVPAIQAVDTLGAGDIFHGAFCWFILGTSFPEALGQAAQVAAAACQSFGTRAWMN